MTAALSLAFVNSPLGWAVILILGLLLFGRRLPGVARNLGQGINEFKKGLNDGPNATKPLDDGSASSRDEQPPTPKKSSIDETSV
ncbi:MAG: twin-arginine translocase TatA/TatE family subunit [Planctomycetota bacterium]